MENTEVLKLSISPNLVSSYKRMAYSAWHAIGEFVDNSSQAYLNSKDALDELYRQEGSGLFVKIEYVTGNNGRIVVSDNSSGMDENELKRALILGEPPINHSGRSRYGLGMKTAAFWLGDRWEIITKRHGDNKIHKMSLSLEQVSKDLNIIYSWQPTDEVNSHYTKVTIEELNHKFAARTVGKIKTFLGSMYRRDIAKGQMELFWCDEPLKWKDIKLQLVKDQISKQPISSEISISLGDGRHVTGWVGVLEKGSRTLAGFSQFVCERVIIGYPQSYRPEEIFGHGGRNDLINQRLVGELDFWGFDVSHTKDVVIWEDEEEEAFESMLVEQCVAMIRLARNRRPTKENRDGPSDLEISAAKDAIEQEVTSSEMKDLIADQILPDAQTVEKIKEDYVKWYIASEEQPWLDFELLDFKVFVFLVGRSPYDPYVAQSTAADVKHIYILINIEHPYWLSLEGSSGVLNYVRECIYDGIALHQTTMIEARIEPHTIRSYKDRLLRIPFEISSHAAKF